MKRRLAVSVLLLLMFCTAFAEKIPPTSYGAYYAGTKQAGKPISFSGFGSYDNDSQSDFGIPEQWQWDFDFNGAFQADLQDGNSIVTWIFATGGVHTVAVKYFDDDGQEGDIWTFPITIIDPQRSYYLTDHLGSIRATVKGGEVMLDEKFEWYLDNWYHQYGSGFISYSGTLTNTSSNESLLLNNTSKELNDGIAAVDVKWNDLNASAALVIRYQNSYYYAVEVYRDRIELKKKLPYATTLLTSAGFTGTVPNQYYRLVVTTEGNSISVVWNNQQVLQYSDVSSPLLSGKVGFRQSGAYQMQWDNLVVTTGSPGKVIAADDYDAWGQVMDGRSFVEGSVDTRYKFTGKERDVETGYDYFGARYYDARIGRWLSVDPLAGKYAAWSPYAYSKDNPVCFFDPNGLWTDPVNKPAYRGWYGNTWQPSHSHFGKVRKGGKQSHQGVDVTAPVGTSVFAVEGGKIAKVTKSKQGFGNVVMLEFKDQNGDTKYAQYAHLSKIEVKVGDEVKEGSVLGETGMSGNASKLDEENEAHLHFGIATTDSPQTGLDDYENPEDYMTIETPQKPEESSDDKKDDTNKKEEEKENNDDSSE